MLNKKILVAAIVGGLFAAGAASAAPLNVTKQYYANEIVFPAGGLVPSAAPALAWKSGYNYSAGETKYVRVELTGAKFGASAVVPTTTNGSVGAVNGLGTNVVTFSVTAGATPIVADDLFSLPLANKIVVPAKNDVSVKVSVYDQASQAQAGGTEGLLAIGSYDNTVFLSFKDSYAFSNKAQTATADVAAQPNNVAYGNFVSEAPHTDTVATLNTGLGIVLVDPDGTAGPQSVTFKADGTAIALTDLFGAASKIEVEGDFSGATAVALDGTASTPAAAAAPNYYKGINKLSWTTIAGGPLTYTVDGKRPIIAGDYKATFTPVAASGDYVVTPLTAPVVGTIRRNGVELQAPLAQVPGDWISRLVLTNTGGTSPKYSIKVLGEDGNTVSTDAAKLVGVVKPGTNVIDLNDVLKGFTGAPRATLVVSVEAADKIGAGTIQGLYQIVNPDKGSISNHVLVRPGTN